MSNQLTTTSAFSVERIRAELIETVRPPKDIVNKAFKKLEAKLEAKETKFFTFRGEVQQRVNVDDNAAQISAADKILSAAGVYARERDAKPPAPAMAVEYDPHTGVLRMVIGSQLSLPTGGDSNVNGGTPEAEPVGHRVLALEASQLSLSLNETSVDNAGEPLVQVIKTRELSKAELARHMFEFLSATD